MPVTSSNIRDRSGARLHARGQEGFTMILAIGVLFVATLLMVAAFTAANGDIHLSHIDTTQKQAYYAALAGVQEYEYQMQVNPDYWETCEGPSASVPNSEESERYEVSLLPAESSKGATSCSTTKPFESMIESSGSEANTFRIKSTGYAGNSKRALVATFKVTGFLNFIYYTNYEVQDPQLSGLEHPEECEVYYSTKRSSNCVVIQFYTGDSVNGPMHTNDAAAICGEPEFGRFKHNPADVVEFGHGTFAPGSCSSKPTFNTSTKSYVKGTQLTPPVSDTSLGSYVESEDEFTGVTKLVLNGLADTITATNKGTTKTIPWPANGLIWVKSAEESCSYSYSYWKADEKQESEEETNCGNVYVNGTYSSALTIGSDDDVIIDGSIYPTSVAGKLGTEPSGTATLGLIANNYVRVYHPVEQTYKPNSKKECNEFNKQEEELNPSTGLCEYTNTNKGCDAPSIEKASEDPNGYGTLKEPWIYAAILSTTHSFVVDNYKCGKQISELNVYGAIAQNFRGAVGTAGGSGYVKDYNYDQRLAVDEPPYFLSPLNAGWKVSRLTAPTEG